MNLKQSPVSSPGRSRPPTNFSRTRAERRLVADAAGAVEQLEGDAALRAGPRCRRRCRRTASGCERAAACPACARRRRCRSPRAARAGSRGCTRPGAPCALLLIAIARRGAVAQHRQRPADAVAQSRCGRITSGRWCITSHLIAFSGTPGPGPGRRVAGRDLAGVGEAGLERRLRLAVEHDDLVAGAGELVGGGHADHAGAENEDLHVRRRLSVPDRRLVPDDGSARGDVGASSGAASSGGACDFARSRPGEPHDAWHGFDRPLPPRMRPHARGDARRPMPPRRDDLTSPAASFIAPGALRRRRRRAGPGPRDLRRQRRPPARRPAAFVNGAAPAGRVRACYPFVRVHTDTVARADSRLSYGFVAGPGTYETTLTRPDLFAQLLPASSSGCCSRTTASRSRSAPARSRSRCTSRSPRTTTSKAP